MGLGSRSGRSWEGNTLLGVASCFGWEIDCQGGRQGRVSWSGCVSECGFVGQMGFRRRCDFAVDVC